MAIKRIDISALAARAAQENEDAAYVASTVTENENMTAEQRANIEKLAAAGDAEAQEALEFIDEAREATFTDALVREKHFRNVILTLPDEPTLDPDRVLMLLFSGISKRMKVRTGRDSVEIKPASPLFRVFDNRNQARKYTKQPIRIPHAFRRADAKGVRRISARGVDYVVPATVLDNGAFDAMKKVLESMPAHFFAWFGKSTNLPRTRDIVWNALHMLPDSMVLDQVWFGRIFEPNGEGTFKRIENGQLYVRFNLSDNEIFLTPATEQSHEFINKLKRLNGIAADPAVAQQMQNKDGGIFGALAELRDKLAADKK